MRKVERGEEHDTTLIKFLPMLVMLLNLACMNFVHTESCLRFQSLWGCTTLLLAMAVVLQSHLDY